MDHLRRSQQASQDNLAGLAGMIAELQAQGGGTAVALPMMGAFGSPGSVELQIHWHINA